MMLPGSLGPNPILQTKSTCENKMGQINASPALGEEDSINKYNLYFPECLAILLACTSEGTIQVFVNNCQNIYYLSLPRVWNPSMLFSQIPSSQCWFDFSCYLLLLLLR